MKFHSNSTYLIYDETQNKYVRRPLNDGYFTQGLTSFSTYAGGTDPKDNEERFNRLRGFDESSGLPRFGCGYDDYFAFRGNPLTEQGTCDVAGINNPMGYSSADVRQLLGIGPFVFKAGESKEIWAAVIGATGVDRLDAVANLWKADDMTQKFFDLGFPALSSPPAPNLTASAFEDKIVLTWQDNAESYEDHSGELLGISIDSGYTADYIKNDFQGYRIYRSLTGLEGSFSLLAQYDKVDGFGTVTEFLQDPNNHLQAREVNLGSNTGLQYHHFDAEVIYGPKYFYAVTAYDAQPYIAGPDSVDIGGIKIREPSGVPLSLESPVFANMVSLYTIKPVLSMIHDAALDSNRAAHTQGYSEGSVTLNIVDPVKVRSLEYRVEFFAIPSDSLGGVLTGTEFLPSDLLAYRFMANDSIQPIDSRTDDPRTFYDKNGNGSYEAGTDISLDESVFAASQGISDTEVTAQPVMIDGVEVKVYGQRPGVKKFLCVANGAGILSSPDQAAFAFNFNGFPTLDGSAANGINDRPQIPNLLSVPGSASAANGGKWVFHAGGTGLNNKYNDGTDSSFFSLVFRGSNFSRFAPFDCEMRFTAAGGYAKFISGVQAAVPFELWNVGSGTPSDASDDYRMYPFIYDEGGASDVWDMTRIDHAGSSFDDDPFTDRVIWMDPANRSPGHAGYDAVVTALGNAALGGEVMANTVLVNWNGGSVADIAWPTNVNQLRPAVGTVFRIVSGKPNTVNDVFSFTPHANTVLASKKDLKHALKNIKVVPNPYYKNFYYTQPEDDPIRFTGLPSSCTIKIFTVAGDLVRTLKHNALSDNDRINNRPYDLNYEPEPLATSVERWDRKTANGHFVAAGMYIALIESPAGKRFVKFAVIQ